jgi:hypothetical protein
MNTVTESVSHGGDSKPQSSSSSLCGDPTVASHAGIDKKRGAELDKEDIEYLKRRRVDEGSPVNLEVVFH